LPQSCKGSAEEFLTSSRQGFADSCASPGQAENCYIFSYWLIYCWLIDLKANILIISRSTNSILALPDESRSALENLGLRLRAQRLAQNMTVEQLAERLLCSPTTCRALESGKPTVSLGLLVHALWLFGKTDELDKLFPLEIGMLGKQRGQRARPATKGISDDERDF
jgi:hypothetical protein